MIVVNSLGEKQIVVQLGESEDLILEQMAARALEDNGYSITLAAKSLGLKRTALAMRLKKWGMNARSPFEKFQAQPIR
jgi:DNA-binding NtrC family response regulator